MSAPPAPLQGRNAFQDLRRRGRRASDRIVRVHFAPARDDRHEVFVSYAVSRKIGGAVVRNLWRRRLRSIAAEAAADLAPGAYLVGLNPEVSNLSFAELRERVIKTMRRAGEQA